MSEHELLIRHARQWASGKGRTLDEDLLDTALELRATHDGQAANLWRPGSARHLMLTRWPAHGPRGVPDVPTLVASLDTFWRFLRATGRMAGASAEPKQLLTEAKAAAKRMPEACNDPERHSITKSLLEFGRGIGITLDDAASADELNDRLQQIMQAWNDQPDEVRMSLPLGAGSAGSLMGGAITDAGPSLLGHGRLPDGAHLPPPPRLDAPDDDAPLFPSDPHDSAEVIRSSQFVRQVFALAEWADGRELTSIGVLRPAIAREAYDALDLWGTWDSVLHAVEQSLSGHPESDEDARERQRNGWRSAGDCRALDRLWQAAVATGQLDTSGRRARRVPDMVPTEATEWVGFGLLAFLGQVHSSMDQRMLLLFLFFLSDQYGDGPADIDDLHELWWQNADHVANIDVGWWRSYQDSQVDRFLAAFGDCGLWRRHGRRVSLTPFGWDVALFLVHASDTGLLDEWDEG